MHFADLYVTGPVIHYPPLSVPNWNAQDGLYGLMSYAFTRRAREIGIRAADLKKHLGDYAEVIVSSSSLNDGQAARPIGNVFWINGDSF